eukprot:2344159-Amphidinium_carterae.1
MIAAPRLLPFTLSLRTCELLRALGETRCQEIASSWKEKQKRKLAQLARKSIDEEQLRLAKDSVLFHSLASRCFAMMSSCTAAPGGSQLEMSSFSEAEKRLLGLVLVVSAAVRTSHV